MFIPVSVNFDTLTILSADHDQHSDTCMSHQIKELDDIYQEFGGYPKSYCLANTTIHQLWWDRNTIDYEDLGAQLGMEIGSISSIKQDPGNTIPYHRDMFHKIRAMHPDRKEKLVRVNIFLESAKLGHMLQFTLDGRHHTVTDWQKNTGYMFDSDVLHLSCNAGMEPKFTLQISGLYLDQSQ
jgi:hypothetical protein